MIACKLCGQEIDPSVQTVYVKVTGWERPGRGVGGVSGSSLVLREKTGELAHAECITRVRSGFNVNQESLV